MGHLPTGFEAAVHRCRTTSNHNWLPCMVGPPFYASFSKRGGGRAPESRKPLPQNSFRGLQGHASTKPPGRSGSPPSSLSPGRQAGTILLEFCRVRDRQSDWRRHFEGQTVPQLHQNMIQMLQNTKKLADSQQPSPSDTSSIEFYISHRFQALSDPAIASSR